MMGEDDVICPKPISVETNKVVVINIFFIVYFVSNNLSTNLPQAFLIALLNDCWLN